MSMQIYAGRVEAHPDFGQVMGPVIDFNCWDETTLAEDADERAERGADPFIPNPDFVADAGMSLSNAKARMLFAQIGLDLEEDAATDFDIDTVHQAATRALNGTAATHTELNTISRGAGGGTMIEYGVPEGYVAQRLTQLLVIISKGRRLGATHVCVI